MFDSRRRFLVRLAGAFAALLPVRGLHAATRARRHAPTHPEPRPGIDASKVLPRDRLKDLPAAQAVFDQVREIPQIVDGLRCSCGCAEVPDNYSLLSCYEGEGMAQYCAICMGEAKLAHRLHRQGRSLQEIRAAIDERFGG